MLYKYQQQQLQSLTSNTCICVQVLSCADVSALVHCCSKLQHAFISVGELYSVAVQASTFKELQRLPLLSSLELHVNLLEGNMSCLPTLAHLTNLKLMIRDHKAGITYADHLPSWISRLHNLHHLSLDIGRQECDRRLCKPCRAEVGMAVHELISNHLPQNLSLLEVRRAVSGKNSAHLTTAAHSINHLSACNPACRCSTATCPTSAMPQALQVSSESFGFRMQPWTRLASASMLLQFPILRSWLWPRWSQART